MGSAVTRQLHIRDRAVLSNGLSFWDHKSDTLLPGRSNSVMLRPRCESHERGRRSFGWSAHRGAVMVAEVRRPVGWRIAVLLCAICAGISLSSSRAVASLRGQTSFEARTEGSPVDTMAGSWWADAGEARLVFGGVQALGSKTRIRAEWLTDFSDRNSLEGSCSLMHSGASAGMSMGMWFRWQESNGKWTRWWRILSDQQVGEPTTFCNFAVTVSTNSHRDIRFHWRLTGILRDANAVLGEYSLALQ